MFPVERQIYKFNESIRGYLFNVVRNKFEDGDWILRLDADEFYHVPPPLFVRERLWHFENCVYSAWYYFRLTAREVADYESGRIDIENDRRRPIEERRRFYKIPHYAEPRMFKYRSNLKWSARASFPHHAGCIARSRMPIRHYPHRDPLQMQCRYRLRSTMMRLGAVAGPHWKTKDWRQDVLCLDSISGQWSEAASGLKLAEGHTTGKLYEWQPGTALPDIEGDFHLGSKIQQWRQRFLIPSLLPVLDRVRPGWPENMVPEVLPTAPGLDNVEI